ncbi:MAG TPA: matrixin family metalloprotease, partial [Thermoanaerobaculia bacterium]
EAGGFANGRGMIVAGSATYEPGTRVVAFLRNRGDGSYYTSSMALGKYRFEGDLLVRDAHGIETMTGDPRESRDAAAFVDELRSGRFTSAPRVSSNARPVSNVDPPQNYVFNDGVPVRPIRWEGCETGCLIGYYKNGTQPGTSNLQTETAIENALAAWTTSSMQLAYAGPTFTNAPADDINDENNILLNYGGAVPGGYCDGSIGCAVVYFGATHTFKSQTWYSVEETDVIVRPASYSQTALETILGHEIGHSLAFRDTAVSNALMNPSLNLSRGATLGTWDSEGLSQVYSNAAPTCSVVSNVSVTGGGNVASGQTATLSVTAAGNTPFTYQWYEGASGVTTTPVGTNSPNFTTPPVTAQKQYWVKVSNACPSSANSTTVTVTPIVCDEPEITNQPASRTIGPNTTASLSVAVNGSSPFSYQWYRATTVGNTSAPVGTNSPNFTTPALTSTTSYWVRVSNNCGSADSSLATITVASACISPTITQQPSTVNLALGTGATLSVTATGDAPLSYQWYEGEAPDQTRPIADATQSSYSAGPYNTAGTYKLWVRVTNACGFRNSQTITVNVACGAVSVPLLSAPPVTHFSTPYTVSWTGNLAVSPAFELQEATNAAFTQNVRTFGVNGALSKLIPAHNEVMTETRFYYRVRAISACTGQATDWSQLASTVVTPPLPANSSNFAISVPVGTTNTFTQDFLIPGFGASATSTDTFSINTDAPWLTVFPRNGALSAGGTTVQLTINPAMLEIGSTTATIAVSRTNGTASNGIATNNTTSNTTMPFSVSLVTPVSPDGRDGGPPPGTLIIPAVAHAQGIGSPFRSDVRIANVSFEDIEYEISYTPSETDGTQQSKKTRLTITAGDTVAFDDIVKAWYGAGVLDEGGVGTIEIRPLNGPGPGSTFASSRTYALAAGGTLGQFIPALRLDQFVGDIGKDSLGRISLQQVANSNAYRTNLGFVEGSGTPVTFLARLLNGKGEELQRYTREIPAFGHMQRSLTSLFGEIPLDDGRVEVEVTSASGKVSAYASVVNNATSDPLLIIPVQAARSRSSRYVLAGIAEFEAGDRNFHSDLRVYNAGFLPETVTLWYYDRGQTNPHPGAAPRQITLAPGEVRAINNVLPTLWPGLIGGGAVLATASPDASLVLTAQTFSRQPDGGTKGQFIPGVTFRDAVGFGERPIHVLQLEESAQYRSNVGVVEVTGAPVDLEIFMVEPDSKTTAVTTFSLQPNEYRQFDRILETLGTVYNGRVSIRVIGGTGRVYAYGSVVDNRTSDPTYVLGQ